MSKTWSQYFISLVLAALLALLVRTFVVTAYKVPTGSMQPTLKPGDFIFATRFDYRLGQPQRGDLVVFSYPQQPSVNFVKRVIGVAGDTVQIQAGQIKVNEEVFKYEDQSTQNLEDNPNPESFSMHSEVGFGKSIIIIRDKTKAPTDFGPFTVPANQVFVLGDNRDVSDDSRYWGAVPINYLHGKVRIIWFSINTQEKWANDTFSSVRWSRLFSIVD